MTNYYEQKTFNDRKDQINFEYNDLNILDESNDIIISNKFNSNLKSLRTMYNNLHDSLINNRNEFYNRKIE